MATRAEADDSASRVGYFIHSVEKRDLKPGDHIYCHRGPFVYNHHGIYIGERGCEVIHFSADEKGRVGRKWGSKRSKATERRVSFLISKRDKFPEGSILYKHYQRQLDEMYDDRTVCIKSDALDDFLYGATLRLASYGSSAFKRVFTLFGSACHKVKAMPPSETIKLAKYFLQNHKDWDDYSVISNNCETFATFCKTGRMDLAVQLHFRPAILEVAYDLLSEPCETFEEALRRFKEQKKK